MRQCVENLPLDCFIRGKLLPLAPTRPLIVIAQRWPSWLLVCVALNLPVQGAYFPSSLHYLFKPPSSQSKIIFYDVNRFIHFTHPAPVIYLVQGSLEFVTMIKHHFWNIQASIIALEPPVSGLSTSALRQLWQVWGNTIASWGLRQFMISYALLGGATSGRFLLLYGNNIASDAVLRTEPNVLQRLQHFINVASSPLPPFYSVPPPPVIPISPPTPVFYAPRVLCQEGLFALAQPLARVCCLSVFYPQKFVIRPLHLTEII